MAVPCARGHLAEGLGLTGHFFRLHQFLTDTLQLVLRVSEQIGEALIDSQPLSVQAYAHDPNWRRVKCLSLETLALDQVGRARAHFAFQHLTVLVVIIAVGLETQQVPHPHAQFGTIHGLREKVLGAGAARAFWPDDRPER